jgi:hypothetical protein
LLRGELFQLVIRRAMIGNHLLRKILDLLLLGSFLRKLAGIHLEHPADGGLVDEGLRVIGGNGRKGERRRSDCQ